MIDRIYDKTNIFYKIINKKTAAEIVYENNHVLCFKDIFPRAPIHLLIVPKKCYIDIFDFSQKATEEEKISIFNAIGELIKNFKIENQGNRVITNSGKDGRQEVPHFHFHLLGGKDIGKMLSN